MKGIVKFLRGLSLTEVIPMAMLLWVVILFFTTGMLQHSVPPGPATWIQHGAPLIFLVAWAIASRDKI